MIFTQRRAHFNMTTCQDFENELFYYRFRRRHIKDVTLTIRTMATSEAATIPIIMI